MPDGVRCEATRRRCEATRHCRQAYLTRGGGGVSSDCDGRTGGFEVGVASAEKFSDEGRVVNLKIDCSSASREDLSA